MSDLSTKIISSFLSLTWYVFAFLLLRNEVGNENYALHMVVMGLIFLAIGLFSHARIWLDRFFEKLWQEKGTRKIIVFAVKAIASLGLAYIGVAIIARAWLVQPEQVRQEDIVYIKGKLTHELDSKRGSRSSGYRKIRLKNFPEYIFEPRYAAALAYNGHVNDSVILGIAKATYEMRFRKTQAMTFREKHIRPGIITVYYFAVNDFVFYDPELNNEISERKSIQTNVSP